MAKKNNCGIIGQGFVGFNLKTVLLERGCIVNTYDVLTEKSSCESIEELTRKTKLIFVCVPTPMQHSGECDTSIVEGILEELNKCCEQHTIVIKSTITVGSTKEFQKRFKFLNLVFSPEFLREATALEDMRNQDRIILGGERVSGVETFFKEMFPNVPILKTDASTAEMVKYATNCFLATKVLFFNEVFQVCEKLNIDYNKIPELLSYDDRIGKTHLQVPGPDKHFAIGGSCFVKDLNAFKWLAKSLDIDPKICDSVWKKTLELRPERDWEQLIGRAVVGDE